MIIYLTDGLFVSVSAAVDAEDRKASPSHLPSFSSHLIRFEALSVVFDSDSDLEPEFESEIEAEPYSGHNPGPGRELLG